MTDQYGLISEDYITDPENLSGTRYTQSMAISVCQLKSIAEAFSSHRCYLDGI